MVGLIPLCENMPSGSAIKPGDVVTAMNGKTIEVGMGYIHVVSILHVHCTCCVHMYMYMEGTQLCNNSVSFNLSLRVIFFDCHPTIQLPKKLNYKISSLSVCVCVCIHGNTCA